jgi:hypothetical protein
MHRKRATQSIFSQEIYLVLAEDPTWRSPGSPFAVLQVRCRKPGRFSPAPPKWGATKVLNWGGIGICGRVTGRLASLASSCLALLHVSVAMIANRGEKRNVSVCLLPCRHLRVSLLV